MTPAKSERVGVRPFNELAAWARLRHEEPLEPALPIIDPHHHVWLDGRGRYLFDELSADVSGGHNILATVFIQSGENMYRADAPAEFKSVGEVEFVNGIAAMAASGRFGKTRLCAGIVGYADLTLGDGVRPVLEALIAAGNGRLRGIRHNMAWDASNATSDPSSANQHNPRARQLAANPVFRAGFAQLSRLGLSFDAWMFYPQLPELVELLRMFPETSVILNHVGGILGVGPYQGRREEVFRDWSKSIRELSKFPNLTIKIGGLGMVRCGWDFHLRELPPSSEELAAAWQPYLDVCVDAFGTGRCMLESNFPVDKVSCGYDVLWNAFKRMTRAFSAAEKSALYAATAARVYRLPALAVIA
jgi:predicted TIM-barrel fold metal-dependent hydrolase